MKKIICILLCITMLCCVLSACGRTTDDKSDYPKIVTTSHVVADWTWNILKGAYDIFQIELLADEGKDMHNFQPGAADLRVIATADLVIYIGGESDKWIEDAIKNVGGQAKSLKLIELVEEHSAECEEEHNHSHGTDEHIWLSFENAIKCTQAITNAVCELDSEKTDVFTSNCQEYIAKLNGLYGEYKSAVASAEYKTLVFADRFPFVYLMEELELDYMAAFPGCSSETTASFETVISLARAVDENSLPCVIVLENSEGIAKTVIENTATKSAQMLALDSMQIMSEEDFDYLAAMQKNLNTLKIALGVE